MNVIFFDGYCGLCNGFIDFMIKVDTHAKFKFSPLQSDFAKATLKPEDISDLKSLVVLSNGKATRKAHGVLLAFSELGGAWKLISVFRILPASFLNLAYDFVAQNRYKFFGKRDTCRLPTVEEKSRFIV